MSCGFRVSRLWGFSVLAIQGLKVSRFNSFRVLGLYGINHWGSRVLRGFRVLGFQGYGVLRF